MARRGFLRRFARFVCLATTVFLSVSLAAGDRQARLLQQTLSAEEGEGRLHVGVNPAVYQRMMNEDRIVLRDFPLPGRESADLDLSVFHVLAPDARFLVVDDDGERPVAAPSFRSFRGRVLGESAGTVTLNLFDGRVSGFVRSRGEEFTITPDFDAEPSTGELVIRAADADPDLPDSPQCEAEAHDSPSSPLLPGGVSDPPLQATALIDPDTPLRADVAIDATYEWYERFNTLNEAQTYILSIMAQVSTIYENEVNVELRVPYLRVFTTPSDPYTDTTSTSVLLDDLRVEWNANQTGVTRTVAHLFSWRPSGGAGVAYIDTLCSSVYSPGFSWDYGVSTISAQGGSWEKRLIAHELGHNFSSPHTHCYSPEIDQCANASGCYAGPVSQTQGTIMSYCSSQAPVFHARVTDEKIRPAAEAAYPACMVALPKDAPPPPPPPENLDGF